MRVSAQETQVATSTLTQQDSASDYLQRSLGPVAISLPFPAVRRNDFNTGLAAGAMDYETTSFY